MDKVTACSKAQLGPSPLMSVSMLVSTMLGVMPSFKIVPGVPPGMGYGVLIAVVLVATTYWAIQITRLWPRVTGGVGGFQLQSRSAVRSVDLAAVTKAGIQTAIAAMS